MKFLLFICTDPEAEPYVAAQDNIGSWVSEMETRGWRTLGDRLRPAAEGTTVRVRGGQRWVDTGGGRDDIVGFDLIDCPTLEDAVECAGRHPMARFGKVEIRPFWPL